MKDEGFADKQTVEQTEICTFVIVELLLQLKIELRWKAHFFSVPKCMQNVFSVDVVVQTVCLHMGDGNGKKWILGASKWFHFPIEPTFKWDRTDAIWLFCMFFTYVTVADIDWNDDDDTLVSTVSSVSSVGCGMWSSEDVGDQRSTSSCSFMCLHDGQLEVHSSCSWPNGGQLEAKMSSMWP